MKEVMFNAYLKWAKGGIAIKNWLAKLESITNNLPMLKYAPHSDYIYTDKSKSSITFIPLLQKKNVLQIYKNFNS